MPYVRQLKKHIPHVIETGDFLIEESERLEKYVDTAKDPREKLQWMLLSFLCSIQGMERRITFSQIEDLATLFDLIEKLPKGQEFDEIREALRKTSEKVRETLEPIKEAYDKAKNFEKRMIENGVYT